MALFCKVNRSQIVEQIRLKGSFLCVGLDSEIGKLPDHLPKSPEGILTFNKAIIDATSSFAVSYKINTAFYEQYGSDGWQIMKETLDYIPPQIFTIADAKRGDIGNTSTMYARAFFEQMTFDAITVAPYMGEDSLKPFLEFKNKWVICLAMTSNPGHHDFQNIDINGKPLYAEVMKKVSTWGSTENLMFVVGATRGSLIQEARKYAPDHFFLVPGVGAQGGSLDEVVEYAKIQDVGLLVNASRSIIYASSNEDFQLAASAEAEKLAKQMALRL